MSRIFLSHSSVNNGPAWALRDWLVSEGWDELFLDVDPERGIAGGERWERALNQAAHRCEVVLFVVSRAWLKSAWCMKEFHLAAKLNKRMFGVLIEDIAIKELPGELTQTWQVVDLAKGSDHAMFQATLPDGREEHVTFSKSGLARLKSGLTKAGLDPRFFAWPPDNDPDRPPYRGLRPMEAEDAGIFFGREAPIVEALDRLRGLRETVPPRFLAILGASGAGKSSFLRAGLLPRLARDDRNFLVLPVVRPERAVISGETGLLKSLSEALAAQGLKQTRSELKKLLSAGSAAVLEVLSRLAEKAKMPKLGEEAEPKPPTLIITIDQGEELFRAEGAEESQAFLALLRDLALAQSPSLTLIVTIRSDSYERLQSVPVLEGIHQQTLSLPPLPTGAYQTVIEGPSIRLKDTPRAFKIEPQLSEALMADIAAGGAKDSLPLLAFTLERLYLEHGGDGDLKLAEYRDIGGIAGSIEAAVARAMEAADNDPAVPRDHAARLALMRRALIPWLAGIDPDTRSPRRAIARLSEIPAETRPLVRHLVDQRLLATDVSQAGEQTIEPAHEALLRQWGLLQDWLKEDLQQLSALEGIQRATRDWLANAKSADWLAHSAGRLEDAEALTMRPDLSAKLDAADHDYLATCRKVETERKDRELQEAKKLAEAQQQYAEEQHKLAEEQKRNATRTRIGLIAASLLAVVAVGLAYYGFQKAGEAETAKQKAETSAQEAAEQRQIAEQRARQALIETQKTSASAQLTKATLTVGDAPRRSLLRATEAIEMLRTLGVAKDGMSDFTAVLNVSRELPAHEVYQGFDLSNLRFFETQDTTLQGFDSANQAGVSPPLSVIGSRSDVGVVDDNGRAVSPPVSFLDGNLGANGAAWLTSDSFVLATGTWDRRGDIPKRPPRKPVNASLRIYDLQGKVLRTLLQDHDAPLSSASVLIKPDGTMLILAGDRLGRVIVAPLDGQPAKILSTGISRDIIRIIPTASATLVVVFGGVDDHGQGRGRVTSELLSVVDAKQRLARELGFEVPPKTEEIIKLEKEFGLNSSPELQVIHYRGENSGAQCATRLPGGGYAICESGAKVSLWRESDDEPYSSFIAGQSDLTTLVSFPSAQFIAAASADGFVRLWSANGKLVSNGQAAAGKSDSAIRAMGFFDEGRKLVAGETANSLRIWDISDVEGTQRLLQIPEDLDYRYRDLSDEYWVRSGNTDLPAAFLAFAKARKSEDEGPDQPNYGYKLSEEGRFLVRTESPDPLSETVPAKPGFAVVDLASQGGEWTEISDPRLLPLERATEANWQYDLGVSAIRSGHICILDEAAPRNLQSEDKRQYRISLVDLAQRAVRGQWTWEIGEHIGQFDIGMGRDGPLCVAARAHTVYLTDGAGTRPIELDLAKFGLPDSSAIVGILIPAEAPIVLVDVQDGSSSARTLFTIDAATQSFLPKRVDFGSGLSLQAISANGQQFIATVRSSSDEDAPRSEVRLLDSELTTIMSLNQVPPDASRYFFSADGGVLRIAKDGVFREFPLETTAILKYANARLRMWSRFARRDALSKEYGRCWEARDWPRCRALLRAARRQFPLDPLFLLYSANVSDRSSEAQVRSTLALYDSVLAKDPYNIFAYNNRGEIYLDTGDFARAKQDFTAVLSLPSSIPLMESGDWGIADPIVKALRRATIETRKQQRSGYYRRRALAFSRLDDWNSVLRDISEIRALGWVGTFALELEARAYLGLGKPSEALARYREALVEFRETPEQGRPDMDEETVKLRSWQALKRADLLIEIAALSRRLGSENEAVLAGDEARQALQSARQSSDITDGITESLLVTEERLNKATSAAVDP